MITLKHIDITLDGTVAIAHLNRPHKANALNQELWFEIEELANWAHETAHVRVVILSARGTYFCAGIDFSLIQKLSSTFLQKPNGRRQEWLFSEIQRMQRAISALERCDKPILAAINGLCVGGGVDLICACDMRYAVTSADFCIKEVDLAIVADIGTIQRLPTIVGEGIARELTMTARTFGAQEALSFRLLNNTYSNQEEMMTSVLKTAHIIASKSPIAIRNTKKTFNYARDHSVSEGLNQVAQLNAGILFSEDSQEAISAMMQKRTPKYND